jgi:DNA-binding transcriptional LysR family regulator
MATEFHEIVREAQGSRPGRRGVVKVSITDGLGTFWVMPLLVDFSRQNPNLIVQIESAANNADVLRLEADLSIQLVRPVEPDLLVVRLGRLHAYPFAAKSYAERYGLPTRKEDMVNHRLVDQVGPQMVDGAWKYHLNLDSVEGIVGIRSNSSAAVFYAIEKGAGIGALPTFAQALDAPVIPVDIDVRHSVDIWLACHPNARATESVSHVIDWIKAIFDPVKYPWFRDEFIHPTDLVAMAPADTRAQSVQGSFAAKPFRE